MPARRFNEEQRQELARLYESGKTFDDLAALYNVDRSTIGKTLKALGVQARKFSPYTAKTILCPYTPDRLQEMYWKLGMSIPEIGVHAGNLLGRDKPVFQSTVKRWLTDAGITIRTFKEAQRLRYRLHPEQFVNTLKALKAVPSWRKRPLKHALTKRIQRMGQKAAAEMRTRESWETRFCALPGCGEPIRRRKSHFRRDVGSTYCCIAHANIHRFQNRRIAIMHLNRLKKARKARNAK